MAAAAEGGPLCDRVARAVIAKFDSLPGRGKPQGTAWTVLAGLVAEDAADGSLRVLALATGTRCVGVAAMATGRGRVVHDCHAEVLCRRAFQRYLLSEMEGPGGEDDAGGERVLAPRAPGASGGRSWELRGGLRLHFYVSALPCGECTLVPISSASEGTLARKWLRQQAGSDGPSQEAAVVPVAAPLVDRNRTGAKPSSGMPQDPRSAGGDFHLQGILRYKSGRSDTRQESRSVCYSCSDKICRWNHVGWQGALLSRLMPKPVAMASIVVGGPLFDEPFVREALYCRAGTAATGLGCPEFRHTLVPFHWSREAIEASGAGLKRTKVSTVGLSVAWSPAVGSGGGCGVAHERSISRSVGGFYDVLMGHTGERQGLRCDRQGKKAGLGGGDGDKSRQADAPRQLDSWVSPLCKCLMAKDLLRALPRLDAVGWLERGGGAEPAPPPAATAAAAAAATPSAAAATPKASPPSAPSALLAPAELPAPTEAAPGVAAASSAAAEAAPSAAEAAPSAAAAPGAAATDADSEAQPPPPKRARADAASAGEAGSAAAQRTYGWLKEALADPAYRERRRRFHSCDVFVHWQGKQDVDAFPLDPCDLGGAAGPRP